MKHLTVIAFILLLCWNSIVSSQPCPPDGISFTTQDQIDSFSIIYPNCTDYDGWIEISGNNITNIDNLSQLESIGHHLYIIDNDNLLSIEGLSNVTHLDDDIKITGNPFLTSLSGLNSLELNNGYFNISNNDALLDLNGLESLTTVNYFFISNNASLSSLSGLENLTTVVSYLSIADNPVLESLTSLHNIHYIKGSLGISELDSLQNLDGLEYLDSVGGYFWLVYNPMLSNLEALGNLSKIDNGFVLEQNINLESLSGLEGLKSIGGLLKIKNCNSLNTLTGLDSLTSIGGDLMIRGNSALQTLSGIDDIEAESIMNLNITYNPQLSTCEVQSVCDYLANPNGDIQIYVNATGCNNSVEVEESCTVGIAEQISGTQLSVFPNPFTTSTTIEYELSEPSHVQLTIYNAIGETILLADEGKLPPGKHTYVWTPERLAEGLYYAELRSGEGVSVVKMIKQ